MILIQPGKGAVSWESSAVEINPVTRFIGKTFFLQLFNKLNLLPDMIRGSGIHMRRQNIEFSKIFLESFRIFFGDIPGGLTIFLRLLLNLIFTTVSVTRQVSHICDIHHMLHRQTIVFQHTPQNILKNITAQVADGEIVVNGWTTGVECDSGRVSGFKSLLFTGGCIVKLDHNKVKIISSLILAFFLIFAQIVPKPLFNPLTLTYPKSII